VRVTLSVFTAAASRVVDTTIVFPTTDASDGRRKRNPSTLPGQTGKRSVIPGSKPASHSICSEKGRCPSTAGPVAFAV
jgi:hypothetical protein